MAWRKRIVRRLAEWTGVNGIHYKTYRFIDIIYYSMEGLKNNRPQYNYDAEGATVGGGGFGNTPKDLRWLAEFINSSIADGSPRTSPEEIRKLTLKARDEMLKGKHKWNIPEYGQRDDWYNEPDDPDDQGW